MLGMEEECLEYSSGCESGWTMYLDQSCYEESSSFSSKGIGLNRKCNEEDEDDLSMMSDASSGPVVFHEDEDEDDFCEGITGFGSASCAALARRSDNSRRVLQKKKNEKEKEKEKSLLWMDDTASSLVKGSKDMKWNNSSSSNNKEKETVQDVLEFSIGFSATPFWGKSALENHYRPFRTSLPGKSASVKPVCRE